MTKKNWFYRCDLCEREFVIWYTSDQEWNSSGFEGKICKHCFEKRCSNPTYITAHEYINEQIEFVGLTRDVIGDEAFEVIKSKFLTELLDVWDTPEETDDHLLCRQTAERSKKACLVSEEQKRRERKFVEFVDENTPMGDLTERTIRPLINEKDDDIKDKVVESVEKSIKAGKDIVTGKFTKKKPTEKKIKEVIKKVKAEARKTEVDTYISQHKDEVRTEPIYLSACADIDLPENSIDLIYTDPPYSPDFTQVYTDLAILAKKVLKPGCLCIAYCGDRNLPDIMKNMSNHLEWHTMMYQLMPQGENRLNYSQQSEVVRHLVVFKKPGKTPKMEWVNNGIKVTRSKKHHEWEQGTEPPEKFIPAYTNVGDTVLDPFVGGGTFPVVCKKIGRKYIGYDIDQDAVNTTLKRLSDTLRNPPLN